MPISTDVTNLKVNVLTQAQYDTAVEAGTITANEISLITDGTVSGVFPSMSGNTGKFLTTDGTNVSWGTVSGGDPLPSQTGNSGKFLTTNGTNASWAAINAVQNTATDSTSLTINGTSATTKMTINIGADSQATQGGVALGYGALTKNYTYRGVAIGFGAKAQEYCVAIGNNAGYAYDFYGSTKNTVAIGNIAYAHANNAIQIGGGDSGYTNSSANTFKVGNGNGNFEMMSANGTIPTDRFTTTPSANGTYVPTLTISNGTVTRSWAAPSGGGSVPTLTWYTVSTAGTTLTIADTSSAQLVKVYKNGLLLQPTEDYTISGTTLTTVSAMVVGDKITTEVF